ncbi:hypothetical protein R3W88_027630 [Solanum pinnatisectum]|uniref:Retrotransposon gag domain-containing protein n=1 Tax=Solanum pinnatisectum TaxID=50273 RepID=A0AAV9LGJ8_9SOLN|nr:hypothetical protein R3W88_027630 [Solanum pinnatisectum]
MPQQRAVRGLPTKRNVEEHELLNAPEVQPQGEVTNVEFREAIKMLSQAVTNQWKGGRVEDAPPASWACFEEGFLGHFFPRELKEAKVREFLTLEQDSLSVHEYGLKFTQLSCYAPEMIADMRSRMCLFVAGLSRLSNKEGRAAMLIGDMDISMLMVYVQQVEEEKLRDRRNQKQER